MKKLITVLVVFIISFQAKAQTFYWNGFSPIFDNQSDTVPIIVSGLQNTIDTSFGVAHICMNITHTYKSDLIISLVSPSGQSVTLIQGIGGSADNFLGTCVGMDGTSFSNAQAPYTGIFVPTGDVSTFNNGQNPNGTWLFIVRDAANADTGSIHQASIVFTNNPPVNGNTGGGGGPTGTYLCPTCICPGGAAGCDLLPDMTSSAKEILLNHNEVPGALYISNATPNIGYGPIDIFGIDSCYCGTTLVPCNTICPNGDDIQHVVKQRIYQKRPGNDTLSYYDRTAGLMTYHATHGHLHVDHWANYTLRVATANPDATTWPIVGTGVKQSFCLINLGTCSGNPGECVDNNGNPVLTAPNNNLGFHTGCGLTQGIYPGNYDVYSLSLNDPIPLVNVCNGNYYIVSITDPENNFIESDETNNWVAVPITLTQQSAALTITPSGPTSICQGGSVTLTANIASNYLWSTGATTQSITVSAAGTYTVSSNCGTSVSTSAPVTVTIIPMSVTASSTPSGPVCNGNAIQLNSTATSTGTQNSPVVFTNTTPVVIPDNNSTGVTSAITVSGISPAALSATSVVSVKLNLTHTYDGDLSISLIAPSGNTILLSNRRGGSGDNFTNTIFNMSATTLIANGTAPFTGSFKPDGNFSSLTGNANGTWLLKVQDLANVDTGRIQNWSLTINNLVPETINYSWTSSPAGFTSALQNPSDNPTINRDYIVTATSSSTGCSASATVPIVVPPALTITSIAPSNGVAGSNVSILGSGFSNVSAVTFNSIASGGFSVINSGTLDAIVPNVAPMSGPICITNTNGCSACSATNFDVVTSISLNLKLFIEGFYISSGTMRATVDPAGRPTVCDTILVELHSATSPFNLVYSFKSTINTNGQGTFLFPSSLLNNSYYITVHHRNALETWSANAVPFTSSTTNYIFSDAQSKAMGNNMRNLGDGNFAIYSGDIDQQGTIEYVDLVSVENATNPTTTGYHKVDVTGDGQVESTDYSLVESNLNHFTVHP
jgi:subtilisin-like proprotein convertase family protein